MTKMTISEFKSKCIGVLKDCRRSGKAVIVTLRGRPIARVGPILESEERRTLGIHQGRMELHGDVVRSETTQDWEVLR
ncbi:MAG: hypothetical protein HXY20_07675 [Acidobacteria bacterium]|nr:hypothetical protein [Acidobacteriota bacterium]